MNDRNEGSVSGPARLMVTAAEACQILGIKRTTFWEFTRCGRIRTVKIGRRGVRVPVSELQRFVDEALQP